jgi:type II secretory pathway component GspD/PulD (secretin)
MDCNLRPPAVLKPYMKRTLLTLLVAIGSVGIGPLVAREVSGAAAQSGPRQVLIEAVILEVAVDRGEVGLDIIDQGTALPTMRMAGTSTIDGANGQPTGFGYTARITDLDATLTTLRRDARVRILQRPRIQTSDAVPASLFVGESRPCPMRGGGTNTEEIPIGTSLDVTPFIKAGGRVTMDLHLRVDRFEGNVVIRNVGEVPITSSREAQTKVDVRDRDTFVLGGLIGTNKTPAQAYVPFPKEVPVPAAMRSRGMNRFQRTELLVLVRPTLLAS